MAVTATAVTRWSGTMNVVGGGGGTGIIIDVGARQRAPGAHGACVEEQTHHATTPRPSAKPMGRDPDIGPKILIPGGLLDRQSGLGGMGDT
jgi:hypothetical protein